jgi:hypothetical protein
MKREVVVMRSTPSTLGPSWLEKVMTETAINGEAFIGFDLGKEEPIAATAFIEDRMDPKLFRNLYMCDPLPEDFPDVPPAALMGERACRECGCTEFNACRHPDHGNCWWVKPDLCSHCENGWGDVS